ncbi:unnamed protein product [Rotaria sordida]|uniref:UBC core domain-containing protein n=1 Tax=Rotaria sordida TaxID=392033 RepID=A0A819T0W1_9BILA|nr:unnamed protein product [Rotaria sordida]
MSHFISGKICVDVINGDGKYNPITPLVIIVKAIPDLINHPQINYSLNVDIDAEYASNRAEVSRKALESVKQHDLPR